MNRDQDLELITKATQAAALLCADLRETYSRASPLVSAAMVAEIERAARIHRRLESYQEAIERREAKS